jgi:hypothetical protein
MPLAAHKVIVRYNSVGNVLSFGSSGDSMSLISGTTYAVSSGRKNAVFNPSQAVVVKDGGVSIGTALTVNHLAGQVTLDSPPSGAVTADFGYFGPTTAFEAREFSINLVRDELDDTVFGDDDKSLLMGLKGGGGTIGALELLDTEWLTGVPGYEVSLQSIHNNEWKFIIEVQLDPTSLRTFRAFCKIPSLDLAAARDGLIEGSFPFTISELTAVNAPGTVSYAFFNRVA